MRQATFAVLCTSALATSAPAQITFQGDQANGHLGAHFDVIGDVNADGIDDLVAGYPNFNNSSPSNGRVVVLSGSDGSILRTHLGAALDDHLGSEVSGAEDVDADGVPDYMAAAIGYGPDKGAVYVYSGATGNQLYFWRGSNAADRFGVSISRAGDMNGDGHADVLVGAPGFNSPSVGAWGSGKVYVLSGIDGSTLHEVGAPNPFANKGFGMFTSGLGDVNADGVVDFMASAPDLDHPGTGGTFVQVLSGADAALLYEHVGQDDGHGSADHVGMGVSNAGDQDGDGVDDYMFGTIIWWWPDDFHEGQAMACYSGATGQWIPTLYHYYYSLPASHPINPTNVGDVNGDGLDDMAYMIPGLDRVRVMEGGHWLVLDEFNTQGTGSLFGTVIRGIADVTGDGLCDIAIGVPNASGPGGGGAGEIQSFSVDVCSTPANYCYSSLNSVGKYAFIWAGGSNSIAANDFLLGASDCPPNKPGLFFYGPEPTLQPFADGYLCVGTGSTGYFRVQPTAVTNAQGTASQLLDNTAGIHGSGPGQLTAGSTWFFQFWYRDPQGGPAGYTFSDGLMVTFCP